MVGSVDRIERDIAAIEQAVMAIGQELQAAYSQYLDDLGQVVRQQLILASYRLCTQGYPDRFLRLSFNQRQALQQALQQLGRKAQSQLMALIDPTAEDTDMVNAGIAIAEASEAETEPENELEDELGLVQEEPSPALAFDQPMSPKKLAEWQESLEDGTIAVLQSISHAANRLLQKNEILPSQLPDPVLEVAAKAGMMAETSSGTPNLLNLLVETEEQEASKVTHIIAIRLRLSEIEFGSATLASGRSKIRGLSARLNQLARDYQKKQRERSIAEAEAAWRSSWFED